MSYHFTDGVQEYLRQAGKETLVLPFSSICPVCGLACGWKRAGWAPRKLRAAVPSPDGLKAEVKLWVPRIVCKNLLRRVCVLPSFRRPLQACRLVRHRRGFACGSERRAVAGVGG